jgi:hypothetical protein
MSVALARPLDALQLLEREHHEPRRLQAKCPRPESNQRTRFRKAGREDDEFAICRGFTTIRSSRDSLRDSDLSLSIVGAVSE